MGGLNLQVLIKINNFGLHGGASWMGAGLDPLNQHLYIPVNHMPWKIRPYFASTEIVPNIPNEFKSEYNFYIQTVQVVMEKKEMEK